MLHAAMLTCCCCVCVHQTTLRRRICAGEFEFPDEYWSGVSDLAKDFVAQLLVLDPKARLTAAQALAHPWLAGTGEALDRARAASTEQALARQRTRVQLSGAQKRLRSKNMEGEKALKKGQLMKQVCAVCCVDCEASAHVCGHCCRDASLRAGACGRSC